ncbi:MAG: hypothetical protein U5L74_09585 [Ideonella sp.]|nr:hypothetical protein [Ideonella sp.]
MIVLIAQYKQYRLRRKYKAIVEMQLMRRVDINVLGEFMISRASANRRWNSLVLVVILYFVAATGTIAQQTNIPMKVLKQFTLPGGSVVAGYEAQSILATGKGKIRLTGTNLAGCNPRHLGAYLYWVVIAEQQSSNFARVKFENTAVKGELIAKGTWSWVNPVDYYYIYRAEVTNLVSAKKKDGCWAFTREWKLSNFPVPEVLGYCVPDWTGGGWFGATPYTYGAQLVVAMAAPPELRAPLREIVVMDGGGFVDGDARFDIKNILASRVATSASFQYFGAGSDLSNSARVIVANQDVGGWNGNLRTDCSRWDHKYTGVNIPLGATSARVFHDANSDSNQVIWVGAVLSVAPMEF